MSDILEALAFAVTITLLVLGLCATIGVTEPPNLTALGAENSLNGSTRAPSNADEDGKF